MSESPEHQLHFQGKTREVGDNPFVHLDYRDDVSAWLSALLGAEHLSLLVGSGLGIAIAGQANTDGLTMDPVSFDPLPESARVNAHAALTAEAGGRGEMNIEDQLRAAIQLYEGLRVLEPDADQTTRWRAMLEMTFTEFAVAGLAMERRIRDAFDGESEAGAHAAGLLAEFLLAFAGRPPSRERLNVFSTNYDRLIEYGADLAGLRVLDRFVGSIEPIFRASRLDLDMHYNPPGIRGEPRYVEGVLRLAKLHGSLDWRFERDHLRRIPLAFGAEDPQLAEDALQRLMIYPNAAKDVETLQYPYAELFRDLAAALCRPNSVLVTFGYGFGDDHINRVIRDMLTLSSTHLAVISYSDPGGRIRDFTSALPKSQYTLLLGSHFGDLDTLVTHHLPQLGSDALLLREHRRRQALGLAAQQMSGEGDDPIDADSGHEQ